MVRLRGRSFRCSRRSRWPSLADITHAKLLATACQGFDFGSDRGTTMPGQRIRYNNGSKTPTDPASSARWPRRRSVPSSRVSKSTALSVPAAPPAIRCRGAFLTTTPALRRSSRKAARFSSAFLETGCGFFWRSRFAQATMPPLAPKNVDKVAAVAPSPAA